MENIYEKVISTTKHKITSEQSVIENNISLNNSEQIEKVLAIKSNVNLDFPIECMDGECITTGKIFNNIVYVTSDGEVNNQLSVSSFSHKIINSNISLNSKANIKANVISSEMEKINNGQAKILTTITFDGIFNNNNEINYLKEAGSDTYLKQQEQEIIVLKGQECDKFEEKIDFCVKNGVKKILMIEVDGILKNWSAGYNFVAIEAELYMKVLYADNQTPSELQTITISKAIKREIEVEGVDKGSDVEASITIVNEHIESVIDELENGETNIAVNIPILACCNVYNKQNILAIQDVYSTKSVLNIESGKIENDILCESEIIDGKIEGNLILNDELRIDKYLSTINTTHCVSNYYIKDKIIFIEGTVTSNIVYINDEMDSIQSIQIEIPFVINKTYNCLNCCEISNLNVCVYDVDVMIKRGREIFFDAKIKANVNFVNKCNNELITKIETLSEIPTRENAIEIYFARQGESFWDIGKSLKIPMEMIRNQNPELADPLDKDQNIALYFQKV